jgi:acetoin utilization protein AcuB
MSFYWYSGEIRAAYDQPGLGWSPSSSKITPIAELQSSKPVTEAGPPSDEHPSGHRTHNPYEHQFQGAPPPRQPALLASQIMSSPVVSLHVDNTTKEAWALMEKSGLRHIPIIDLKLRPVGMISDRDLFTSSSHFKFQDKQPDWESIRIGTYMKNRILTALPSTEIRQIARVMLTEHVGAMPVVTEPGELVGIITRTDILRTVTNEVPLELWI